MNPLTLEQQYRTESQCQGNPPSSVSLECPADCYGIDTSGHVGMERQQTALRRATSGVFRLVASGKIKHSLVVVALYHFDLWQRGLK